MEPSLRDGPAEVVPPATSHPSEALGKTYDLARAEARWQADWKARGAFHPDPAAASESFSVVIVR